MRNYIMESVKNILGESSIGQKEIEKNLLILDELKRWLQSMIQDGENDDNLDIYTLKMVINKIEELENN